MVGQFYKYFYFFHYDFYAALFTFTINVNISEPKIVIYISFILLVKLYFSLLYYFLYSRYLYKKNQTYPLFLIMFDFFIYSNFLFCLLPTYLYFCLFLFLLSDFNTTILSSRIRYYYLKPSQNRACATNAHGSLYNSSSHSI